MAEKYIQVPPDSTGKKVHVVQFNDGTNDIEQPVYVLADGNGNYQNLQRVGARGSAYVRYTEGDPNVDAGGMLSVNEHEILDSIFPWYKISVRNELFTELISGSGSSIELSTINEPACVFTTGTISGSIVQRTTNKRVSPSLSVGRYHHFTILVGDSGKTNVVRRWGSYDDNGGFFIELNGTDLYAVLRSDASGSVEDFKIPRSSWDDPLDGTGFSAFSIDISKIQSWWIDVSTHGSVRFGVYDDKNARITAYTYSPVNSQVTSKYIPLPVRWEQFNTDTVASVSQMKVGPSYVTAIGGRGDGSYDTNSDMLQTPVSISNTWTPVCSMRLKETYGGKENRIVFVPVHMDTFSYGSSGGYAIRFIKNGILTGDSWSFSFVNSDGPIEGDVDATSVSGGRLVAKFICDNGNDSEDLTHYFSYQKEYLTRLADNSSSQTYTIEAKTLIPGDTADLWFSMVWREYE